MSLFWRAWRQRRRDWPVSLAFVTVLGAALALAGAWLAIAGPLRPSRLPFAQPERVVALETAKKGVAGGLSWMDVDDLRSSRVEAIAGYAPRTWGLQTRERGPVEVVRSQQVTGEFFAVLGVRPARGESLSRRHEQSGNQEWLWLTDASWRRLLGGAEDAVGRVVWINSVAYRVAGILPPSFDFPAGGESVDVYLPLKRADYYGARGGGGLGAIARLREGVGGGEFGQELAARSTADVSFRTVDLTRLLLGDRRRMLDWLLAAVAVLLLVAVANASGIWLAQWLRQQRNAAIQLALGASRGRLWREQLAQATLLGLGAAAVGVGGGVWLLAGLRASAWLAPELGRFELWSEARVTGETALMILAVALVASWLSAVLPLLPLLTVRGGWQAGTATSRSSRRMRMVLAVSQLTLTAVLAYAGWWIGRNVQALFAADRGYRAEQVVTAGIGIPESRYSSDERMIDFHRRAIEELGRIPGVQRAAGGIGLPTGTTRTRFLLDDENVPRDEQRTARFGVASGELLALLDIPLRQGRGFAASDRWGAPRVALVNQAFVDRYQGGIGHRLRVSFYNGFAMKAYEAHEIVGVVANTLNRDLALETEPQILISANQIALEGFTYFLKTTLPAHSLREAVAEAIWQVDPEIERIRPQALSERVERALLGRRTMAWLLGVFFGLAALMVSFGLASSLSATFVEMTRELGIRAALGATPGALARSAVGWGLAAVGISWLLALPLTYALSRLVVLEAGVAGWQLPTWLGAGLALAAIGGLAAWGPARRAARVNPALTLRAE